MHFKFFTFLSVGLFLCFFLADFLGADFLANLADKLRQGLYALIPGKTAPYGYSLICLFLLPDDQHIGHFFQAALTDFIANFLRTVIRGA